MFSYSCRGIDRRVAELEEFFGLDREIQIVVQIALDRLVGGY